MLARHSGEVIDRDEYIVVRTPNNPTYHWGNYLIFRTPPRSGDEARWCERFDDEFASLPGPRNHRLLAWDTADGDSTGVIDPFVAKGMQLETAVALTATAITLPPRPNLDMEVRRIESPSDWQEAIELQVLTRDPAHSLEGYRTFKEEQFANYRRMSESGVGDWYGAFLGDTLVGDLGIYHEGGVARFQSVSTHPSHRRRGVCGTLVHQSATMLRALTPIQTFVMEADPEYHAARIYESVGFTPCETNHALYWHSGMKSTT